MDLQALPAAMDDNLAEHACHLHRHAPGMSVTWNEPRRSGVMVCDSGLDDDTFNIVAAARFGGDEHGGRDVDARITAVLAGLAPRPYTWWIGPSSTPADLSDRLLARGLLIGEHEAAMWAPLDVALPSPSYPVRVAATTEDLDDFATVVAANWTPPSATVRAFFARTARWALSVESQARYLIGYDGLLPVAAAEVFFGAGVAGFFNVCTLASHRRRGYAGALMVKGMHLAAEAGYADAVLQASDGGRSVYERLGFRTVGTVVEHAIRRN